jgi:hypothetical protein
LLSGTIFQPAPSLSASIEFATSARPSSGVMARFTGGPKSEFVSGRLTTIAGAQRIGADVDDRHGVLAGPAEDVRARIADADLLVVADDDQFALAGRRIHRSTAGE